MGVWVKEMTNEEQKLIIQNVIEQLSKAESVVLQFTHPSFSDTYAEHHAIYIAISDAISQLDEWLKHESEWMKPWQTKNK